VEASRARSPLRLLGRKSDRGFEQLYRRHARQVYQYALAVLANPADAEDVTQTTFLNAYRAYQRGERPQKPHNWLIAIAHNVCRMRWRQAGSRPREIALEEAPEPVSHDEERPDLDEVLTALAQLSFNQRAALVMRELEGRSYQEIADVLGVSLSAVEALLFRARRNLQVRRKALGVLTTVPLPGSLASFVGGGGGIAAVGGAGFGADLVLKAAAVVAVGAAAAGGGYKVAHAAKASQPVAAAAQAAPAAAAPRSHATVRAGKTKTTQLTRGSKTHSRLRRAVATTAAERVSRPTAPAGGSAAAPAEPSAPSGAAPAPPPPPAINVPLPPPPPVNLPPVPPVPPLPPLPPPPPVTVPPVPPLPPPPPLP
jgi:RNA polymerase sigma factor (sigma-70 family)